MPWLWRCAAVVAPLLAPLLGWVLVTWPWTTRMWTQVPGGDGAGFVWSFWWWRHALESGMWPLSTDAMFAPLGQVPLAFHTGMPLPAVVSIPLQWLVGAPLAYNLIAVALVVAACVCTALLARDLGIPRWGALVAGLAFAFSPALTDRYARLEHLNLACVFWVPLLLLLLRRWERAPTPARAALVGVVGAAAVWTDFTVAVFAALAAATWAAGTAVLGTRGRHPVRFAVVLRSLAVAGIACVLLIAPLALAMRSAVDGGALDGDTGLGGSPAFSTDLAGLLVGDADNPLLGSLTGPLDERLGSRGEGANDLGVIIGALAATGAVATWRRRATWWLIGLAVLAVLLSLGPVLHLAGRELVPLAVASGDRSVSGLLPFTWVQRVPGLDGLRAPGRFAILAALPLALLAGQGFSRLARVGHAGWVALAVVPLLLVEAASPVDDRVEVALPAVYRTVAADPDPDVVVVDVPLGFRTGFSSRGRWSDSAMVHATQHGKPVAAGFVSRMSRERLDAVAALPLYRDLMALQDLRPGDAAPITDPTEGRASAVEHALTYVVLDTAVPGKAEVRSYLDAACYARVDVDAGHELYRFDCDVPSPRTSTAEAER